MSPASTEKPLVAVTGATGFVGRFLVDDLARRGFRLRVLLRRPTETIQGAEQVPVGDLAYPVNLEEAMRDADYVVHSAGIAHAMSGRPEDDYRAINRDATRALALAARAAGVRRFVFLSSLRAQSGPHAETALSDEDVPRPTDAYGRSKLEAEKALADVGLPFVVLRPALVYGPGVKGNLAALLALARKPWPLPFGGFRARRSLIALETLASAIETVIRNDAALNHAFLVADPDPVSLAEIITAYRAGFGMPPGLLPVPQGLVTGMLALAGRGEMAERLSGSLVVRTNGLSALGWRAPTTTQEGLTALGRRDAIGDGNDGGPQRPTPQ